MNLLRVFHLIVCVTDEHEINFVAVNHKPLTFLHMYSSKVESAQTVLLLLCFRFTGKPLTDIKPSSCASSAISFNQKTSGTFDYSPFQF